MRRIILLSFIFLLSTVWAAAQTGSGSNSGSQPTSPVTSPATSPATSPVPNQMTIQGCLGGAVGEFTLTDKTGITYQLNGNTDKMNAHVGETVRVTGLRPSGGALPGAMSEDVGSNTPPSLSVISFEHVSTKCE